MKHVWSLMLVQIQEKKTANSATFFTKEMRLFYHHFNSIQEMKGELQVCGNTKGNPSGKDRKLKMA